MCYVLTELYVLTMYIENAVLKNRLVFLNTILICQLYFNKLKSKMNNYHISKMNDYSHSLRVKKKWNKCEASEWMVELLASLLHTVGL